MMHHINRRQIRAQMLTAQIMHILDRHLKDGAHRDVARELEELFYARGAYVVTDAERAQAGLSPRDHHGLTIEELVAIEGRMMEALLMPVRTPDLGEGKP